VAIRRSWLNCQFRPWQIHLLEKAESVFAMPENREKMPLWQDKVPSSFTFSQSWFLHEHTINAKNMKI